MSRTPKIYKLSLPGLLLALSIMSACSSMQVSPETTAIEITQLTYLGRGDSGERYLVELNVQNAADTAIELSGININVRLASEGFIRGSGGPFVVPAMGETDLALDLQTEFIASVSQLMTFVEGPDNRLPYIITGDLIVSARPPRFVGFQYRGRAPFVIGRAD